MSNVRSAQTDKVRFFGNTTPQELAAQYGTPLYVYNEDVLRRRCRELLSLSSLPGFHVNYSAKANTNLALLRIVREEGCHADAMSPGELHINKLPGSRPTASCTSGTTFPPKKGETPRTTASSSAWIPCRSSTSTARSTPAAR